MPAAFTEAERKRIARRLRKEGLRLFGSQGLRKTSLDDLVRPIGIAKSTFYVFFDSKEALYLDLMRHRMADVKRQVIDEALEKGTDTRDGLRRFLRATIEVLRTDPLYRRLMDEPEELDAVTAKVDPDADLGADNPATALMAYIAEYEADFVREDPAVIVGVLQTVLLLPVHAERLGPELFPEILDRVIDLVAAGLTNVEGEKRR